MPQRYTVTVVAAGEGQRPTLLVPFEPSALVSAFIDEIFKRLGRRGGLEGIDPGTHIAVLHVDSETGAVVDFEDVLGDVVDPTEKLFAVLQAKTVTAGGNLQRPPVPTTSTAGAGEILIRVITPAMVQSTTQMTPPTFSISCKSTIFELHQRAAQVLGVPANFGDKDITHECNCHLAQDLVTAPSFLSDKGTFVIYGKSEIRKVELGSPTEDGLETAVRQTLGQHVESTKKLNFFGAQFSQANRTIYTKAPVVAIWPKLRHIPQHARSVEAEEGQTADHLLDLHTSEMPINFACMDVTIEQSGLVALAVEGVVDIFAVLRSTSGSTSIFRTSRDNIYRAGLHWQPPTAQSDRGIAMFLSSLRVFSHLVESMRLDERAQDAVLHTFDLLTRFPPSIRALHVLINGRTPNFSECAALSHAIYEVLDRFVPQELVGTDHKRVFEGARLLFGFILEKARSLKLPEGTSTLPYISSLKIVDLRDCRTTEPVIQAVVESSEGLMERALFETLNSGVLTGSRLSLPPGSTSSVAEPSISRAALLSAGSYPELLTFSASTLASCYSYPDNGDVALAWAAHELKEVHHLSEFCGRNKLDKGSRFSLYGRGRVRRPRKVLLVFRPMHGTETVDTAVIEQVMAPILKRYEADRTAVFDALGGSAARRLQAPEEVLMFVVDTSASMRSKTDFVEVNEDDLSESEAESDNAISVTDPAHFTQASFDDVKDMLRRYPDLREMLAIVAQAPGWRQRHAAKQVIELLRIMLGQEIVQKQKALESTRQLSRTQYWLRHDLTEIETQLNQIKTFWASL